MTKEQYKHIEDYLNMNNIELDLKQLTELEDRIAEAKGNERPILVVEEDHVYFDNTRRDRLVSVMLELLTAQPDAVKNSLALAFYAIAGHLIAMSPTDSDMFRLLDRFAGYVRDTRRELSELE